MQGVFDWVTQCDINKALRMKNVFGKEVESEKEERVWKDGGRIERIVGRLSYEDGRDGMCSPVLRRGKTRRAAAPIAG